MLNVDACAPVEAALPENDDFSSAGTLSRLLAPRSVAIVGASDRNNMSLCVHSNLIRHGFPGPVHLVNPNKRTVHNRNAVASLGDIPEPVDLVFSLVNAGRVPGLMEEAASFGIGNLVVLSGGFAEEGTKGAAVQQQLVETAGRHKQMVLGPNTIGFLNLHARTVLYGSPLVPPAYPDQLVDAGSVGVIVQSGIVAHTMIRGLLGRGAGISVAVAVGNEATVGIHHLIKHLAQDGVTKVIALFVETIRDRRAFEEACLLAAAAGKPIVALKGGRSKAGAATAVSHTGALAGDAAVNAAAFRRLGIVPAMSMEELVVTAAHLSHHGAAKGKRVAFLALSGGFCELFADRAAEVGLEMPPLASATVEQLRTILPEGTALSNPLDTTGIAQSDATIFPRAMAALASDPGIDTVFVGRNVWRAQPLDGVSIVERFSPWGDAMRAANKPILVVSDLMTDSIPFEREFTSKAGLPAEIGGITHGLQAFARGADWRSRVQSIREYESSLNRSRAPVKLRADTGMPMAEHQVLSLLQDAGCPVVPWILAQTCEEAVAAGDALGYPVVVKISSASLPHKSAIGGVMLNVQNAAEVERSWDRVVRAAHCVVEPGQVDGVVVMPMRPPAIELIVGVKRDANWGLTLVLGFGGVWTELLKDAAVLPLPVSRADVVEMLSSLKGVGLLKGGHGLPPADIDLISDAVAKVGKLAEDLGEALDSLEVNPLRVHGGSVEALDGLIVWNR